MENSMSRLLIETTVRQALKNLREDPQRSTRNLIDMALQFSQGRFQNRFFETAQTMLKNENSAYYSLVQDAAGHIETEHLVRFGMNLGYNSCTWGAHRIRTNEQALGFNIPWTVLLKMEGDFSALQSEKYDAVITEGEGLGICCWMLFAPQADPVRLLPLAQAHPDSAFFLFCPSGTVTPLLAEKLEPLYNLMPVVRFDFASGAACSLLRKARLPYSLYCPYSRKEASSFIDGSLFAAAQRLHPIFTALIFRPDCPIKTRAAVYRAVVEIRKKQLFETVPWELYEDTCMLDEIISDDACWICFDGKGILRSPEGTSRPDCGNLFDCGLRAVIRQACPKPSSISFYRQA